MTFDPFCFTVQEWMYDAIHTEVVGKKRRQYAMALVLMDDAVAKIHSSLESVGQLNNTYIIFA